jgi:two-component system cell cycle sensor histidine kinase PleC
VISHISSLSDAGVISKLSNAQDRRRVYITFTRQFQAILSDYKFRCLNDFGDHIVPKGEDDLRHRAEQAEIANHSKTTLLANMGHDLRVPLNSIIGFCEMMQGGVKGQIQPPEYLEYIGDIHAAAGQLVNLVNDIIDLSQVELTGSLPLKPVVVSPDLIIAECLRMIRPFAESKEIRIITKDSPELPGLYVDPLRLRQILLNLISNAAKFTPPGGRVTVSTHMNDQGGVCLSVADTGQGIAETELDAAMELFRRGAVAESQIEGAGLGLSIAKALVELYGGWISIESREAKGTTVTVNFPPSRTR